GIRRVMRDARRRRRRARRAARPTPTSRWRPHRGHRSRPGCWRARACRIAAGTRRHRTMAPRMTHDELGFYVLAGQPRSSRELVDEVRTGEALGFGTAFISERYNKKEAATLSGAAGAVSERIRIETAATNHNTRHPMVTAGFARTMQSLTGGRFVLGLGRGIPALQDAYGIDRVTTAQLEDFVGIMR